MRLPESRTERLLFRWSLAAYAVASAALLFEIQRRGGPQDLLSLGKYAVTSVLFLGKFVIFLGLPVEASFGPGALAVLVVFLDLAFAFLLAFGIEGLENVPGVGRWLRRSRRRATRILAEYPGLVRMAFLGVVFFVMLPLAATGAISGSFAARLAGLSRIGGLCAIAIGSAGTAVTFYLLATLLGARAEDLARSPALVGALILVLVVVGRLAYVRVTSQLKREPGASDQTHP